MASYTTTTALLSDDGETRERVTFYVPAGGGYVTYADRDGHDRQICHRLRTLGDTLRSSEAGLRRTIQRHIRLARYDARRGDLRGAHRRRGSEY